MEKKLLEKSGSFVSPEKWEPCSHWWCLLSIFSLMLSQRSNALYPFPDMDSDPNPGTDIRPKSQYSSGWGFEFG